MLPTRGRVEGESVKQGIKARSVGAWASVTLGLTYVLVGTGYLMQPELQKSGTIDEALGSLAIDPLGYKILNWSLAVGGVAALAAVPWICSRLTDDKSGWIAWARNLGLVGFAVAAVNGFRSLNLAMDEAENYVHHLCDEACKLAVRGDFVHMSLDPDGWMTFGAVGAFVLITTIVAMKQRAIPALLAIVGLGGGVSYWLVVLGNVAGIDSVISIAAAVGGVILGPIFYIGMGLTLGHNSGRELTVSNAG